jgi:hypothetical protein
LPSKQRRLSCCYRCRRFPPPVDAFCGSSALGETDCHTFARSFNSHSLCSFCWNGFRALNVNALLLAASYTIVNLLRISPTRSNWDFPAAMHRRRARSAVRLLAVFTAVIHASSTAPGRVWVLLSDFKPTPGLGLDRQPKNAIVEVGVQQKLLLGRCRYSRRILWNSRQVQSSTWNSRV